MRIDLVDAVFGLGIDPHVAGSMLQMCVLILSTCHFWREKVPAPTMIDLNFQFSDFGKEIQIKNSLETFPSV